MLIGFGEVRGRGRDGHPRGLVKGAQRLGQGRASRRVVVVQIRIGVMILVSLASRW